MLLPRTHAQGVKQSVCVSVVVVVVVIRTKIACLGDLGTWATSKANEYVEISENWPQYTQNRSALNISVTKGL